MKVKDVSRHVAFANLTHRDMFMRKKISTEWAERIGAVKRLAARKVRDVLNKPFPKVESDLLEKKVIEQIGAGQFASPRDLTKLADSFTQDPKNIKKFIDSDVSALELYTTSGAKGAYYLRNARNAANWIRSNGEQFLKLKDVKLDATTVRIFKEAKETLEDLLALVGE
jgi:hypothetical protein